MKKPLFEIKEIDRKVYHEELEDFLPEKLIDVHTRGCPNQLRSGTDQKGCQVAKHGCKGQLSGRPHRNIRSYVSRKKVTPLCFSNIGKGEDFDPFNDYVAEQTKNTGSRLFFTHRLIGVQRPFRKKSAGAVFSE